MRQCQSLLFRVWPFPAYTVVLKRLAPRANNRVERPRFSPNCYTRNGFSQSWRESRRFHLPGAIGFDGGHEIAWCMPRGPLSSLIQQQTLVANDDNYALAA